MMQPQKKPNPLIERAKEVDTPIYFIAGLVLLCIGTIVYYLFFRTADTPENTDEMAMPESNTVVEDYNSKIQAYERNKKKEETSLSLDFNKGFLAQEDTLQTQQDITQDKRFQELEAQIEEAPQPTPTRKRVQRSANVYEDDTMWETAPKRENKATKTATGRKVVPKEEPYDFQTDLTSVENKKEDPAPKKKSRFGEKLSFEDLPETEQRRILLQTGQRTYQESSEIMAKIISTGEVKAGQTIRLMLQEKAVLSFKVIPRGTTISGVVSFNDNRMKVNFSTIRLKNEIINVNLELYAMDGIHGLPISGESHTKETEDEGIDEAISRTGRIGRVIGSVAKSVRRNKEVSVNLGNDIACILVNNNIEE